MIEMLRICSNGFSENATIEELPPEGKQHYVNLSLDITYVFMYVNY
jgi:hypothetical protein